MIINVLGTERIRIFMKAERHNKGQPPERENHLVNKQFYYFLNKYI